MLFIVFVLSHSNSLHLFPRKKIATVPVMEVIPHTPSLTLQVGSQTVIVCEQCEYFGRLSLVVLDGQVGSCCDQHVADTPALVGGCLMKRRLTAARRREEECRSDFRERRQSSWAIQLGTFGRVTPPLPRTKI